MQYQVLNNWRAGQDSNLQPDRYERPTENEIRRKSTDLDETRRVLFAFGSSQ
jgi:hypothetical protein